MASAQPRSAAHREDAARARCPGRRWARPQLTAGWHGGPGRRGQRTRLLVLALLRDKRPPVTRPTSQGAFLICKVEEFEQKSCEAPARRRAVAVTLDLATATFSFSHLVVEEKPRYLQRRVCGGS